MQRVLRAEVVQDVVGDAVRDLVPCVPLANSPQNVPMIELTACPPSAGSAVDQRDLAAETRRFQRRRDAGDSGAQHADVRRHVRGAAPAGRRTIRVAVEILGWSGSMGSQVASTRRTIQILPS